jgi:hypothetical protein
MVQVPPGPHSSMEHPPPVHAPSLQAAFSPLQVMVQPPPHESMSQRLPAPQAGSWQPPLVQSFNRQTLFSPLQSRLQPPMQLGMVQFALRQGIVQPPVSVHSVVQVAPGLQVV